MLLWMWYFSEGACLTSGGLFGGGLSRLGSKKSIQWSQISFQVFGTHAWRIYRPTFLFWLTPWRVVTWKLNKTPAQSTHRDIFCTIYCQMFYTTTSNQNNSSSLKPFYVFPFSREELASSETNTNTKTNGIHALYFSHWEKTKSQLWIYSPLSGQPLYTFTGIWNWRLSLGEHKKQQHVPNLVQEECSLR